MRDFERVKSTENKRCKKKKKVIKKSQCRYGLCPHLRRRGERNTYVTQSYVAEFGQHHCMSRRVP